MKAFLFALALLGGTSLFAHQGEISSTLLVERADGAWELHLVAALTAFQYEVQTHYGKDSYATPEAFQELVMDHLENTITIRFNDGTAAELTPLSVTLGHETQVAFALSGVPDSITEIVVTNTAFMDIYQNRSALVIMKPGSEKQQFELKADNQHTATLAFGSYTLRAAETAEASVPPYVLALLGVITLAGLAFAWIRNKHA